MEPAAPFDEAWIRHVASTYSLDQDLVRRLGEEFLAVTDTTVRSFVVESHLRWQAQGRTNREIFAWLQGEVAQRRFRAEVPSLRQVRRMIYG